MKARGVIISLLALIIFFTAYAKAHELEPEPVSAAKPVMVPYLNKTITEVKQNEYTRAITGHPEEAGADRTDAGENPYAFNDILTKTGPYDPLPELVGTEAGGDGADPVLTDWVYYGNSRITHYDAGPCCCGDFATGCTASGVLATINHTVASGEDLPFGTEVLINGVIYTVEDRGVGPYEFDIFVSTHDEALSMGMYYTDVYVR